MMVRTDTESFRTICHLIKMLETFEDFNIEFWVYFFVHLVGHEMLNVRIEDGNIS